MSFDSSSQLALTSQASATQSTAPNSQVYTVEQLNAHIRALIEGQLGTVWVQAEISNFKPHTSGHFYFSLKDAKAQISAVMFRGHNSKLKFKPHDGLEVIVRGKITVYEPRGNYQIACEMMEPVGAGALQKQFEQLKEKLKLEGLFETSRKKPIPTYPKSVAVVTSPTGAAIQDILNIMNRRAKTVEVTVVPTIVQGAAAAPALCEAFLKAEKLKPDVIIIGRGGGSIEDMWCFNDEKLARLIAASEIPVISAVGHEIDFTICDFVSDLRAPTPSAAAELVAKSSHEIIQKLEQLDRLLKVSIQNFLHRKVQSINFLSKRLIDPKKKLQDLMQRRDELTTRLEQAMGSHLDSLKKDVQVLRSKLVTPKLVIEKLSHAVQTLELKLKNALSKKVKNQDSRLKTAMAQLHALSPLDVVVRGYSITKTQNTVVKSIHQVSKKDRIEIKVSDGHIHAEVTDITKG